MQHKTYHNTMYRLLYMGVFIYVLYTNYSFMYCALVIVSIFVAVDVVIVVRFSFCSFFYYYLLYFYDLVIKGHFFTYGVLMIGQKYIILRLGNIIRCCCCCFCSFGFVLFFSSFFIEIRKMLIIAM